MRFCVVRIWIVRILKNTPDLHSAYYRFLALSDHLYYSGTCVVRFYIVWFRIVHTFFWILRAHYARTYCNLIISIYLPNKSSFKMRYVTLSSSFILSLMIMFIFCDKICPIIDQKTDFW